MGVRPPELYEATYPHLCDYCFTAIREGEVFGYYEGLSAMHDLCLEQCSSLEGL